MSLDQPITPEYRLPAGESDFLRANDQAVAIPSEPWIVKGNEYYEAGLPGSHPEMFLRSAVLLRLREAEKLLPSHLAFFVFDAFRSLETQRALFEHIKIEVISRHPELEGDEVIQKTRTYVADPDDKSRFRVLPHHSGGAIDIALCERDSHELLDFGGPFDDPSPKSATAFFESPRDTNLGISEERWKKIRDHRRMLFNLLKEVGFTNYHNEWWHFDLGNEIWSRHLGIPAVFNSLNPSNIKTT